MSEFGEAGQRLHDAVLEEYELEVYEHRVLIECARTADQLDLLAEVAAKEGPLTPDGRVHPSLVEARQQRLALSKLLASLRIPTGDSGDRPQRRTGARGHYGVA